VPKPIIDAWLRRTYHRLWLGLGQLYASRRTAIREALCPYHSLYH
jgi:hypothetical protein